MRHVLALSLICLAAHGAAAEPAWEEGRPFIRSFRARDLGAEVGAGPQFFTACQDRRGLLYFGNNAGVLEYDGAAWRLIPLSNEGDALSCDVDPSGRVWIGGSGVFGHLAPDERGRLRFVDLSGRLPEADRNFGDVWQTSVTPEGVLFRTPFALFRVAGERIETWKTTDLASGYVFHVGGLVGGRLYLREHRRGLLVLDGGELRLVPGGERFATEQIFVYLPFDGQRVLLGTRTQGLLLLDPRAASPEAAFAAFPTEADAFLRENQIYHGAVLADGTFALTTVRGGVVVVDRQGKMLKLLDRERGLADDMVLFAFPDRQGNLWLGMNDGLSLVELPSSLSRFGEGSGLEGSVEAVVRHRGSIYIATSRGFFRLAPPAGRGDEARFEPVRGVEIEAFDLLVADGVLLGGADDGIYAIEGDEARRLAVTNARTLASSVGAGPPRVFVGTLGGVVVLVRAAAGWIVDRRFGQAGDDVVRIAEAAPGELWVGLRYGGVLRILYGSRDGRAELRKLERYGEPDGLPKGSVLPFRLAGGMVFGTRRGFLRFDPQARRFAPDPELAGPPSRPLDSILTLAEERDGSFWASSNKRAIRLEPRAGGRYVPVATPLARIPEGVRVLGFSSDPDGVTWVGTGDGLVRYDPRRASGRSTGFETVLRRVTARGRGELWGGGGGPAGPATLPFAQNSLRLEFAATSFAAAERNRYQVKLEGLDRDWSPWSTETYKDYTSLPWGRYAFLARAENVYGQVVEARLLDVRILPPWWATWWARALFVIAGMAAIAGVVLAVVRLRTRRLERRNRELEAAVAETTRQLREASLTDPLTGLSNRRFFDEVAEREAAAALRASRSDEPGGELLAVLIDLDHFKQVNDRYGHQEGDRVLQEAAVRLGRVARASDHLFRWGGEEFLILARGTGREQAPELAHRLLEAFRAERTDLGGGLSMPPTCSIGWAPYPFFPDAPEVLSLDDVLAIADKALYLAKRGGRNQAVGAEPAAAATAVAERWPGWREARLDEGDGAWVRLVRLPPERPAAVA